MESPHVKPHNLRSSVCSCSNNWVFVSHPSSTTSIFDMSVGTHHQPCVSGLCLLCPCCCCDMETRPLSRPHFDPDPRLTLGTRQVKLPPGCPPVQTLNSSQCSQFEASLQPGIQPHTAPLPVCLQTLCDSWGLRGWSGCRCSGTWAQRWGWSAGRQRGCQGLWSWCRGRRKAPGRTPRTEPPGQQHPGSAVERTMRIIKKHRKLLIIISYVWTTLQWLQLLFLRVSHKKSVFVRFCSILVQYDAPNLILVKALRWSAGQTSALFRTSAPREPHQSAAGPWILMMRNSAVRLCFCLVCFLVLLRFYLNFLRSTSVLRKALRIPNVQMKKVIRRIVNIRQINEWGIYWLWHFVEQ